MNKIVVRRRLFWLLFGAFFACAIWSGTSIVAGKKMARGYGGVAEERGGYTVRSLPESLAVRVEIAGSWDVAASEGARIVRAFFAGDNTVGNSAVHERIGAPRALIMEPIRSGYAVSAILPASVTLASLPRPNDPRIRIVSYPEGSWAMLQHTGQAREGTFARLRSVLATRLAGQKRLTLSEYRFVSYSPEWAFPLARVVEVQVRTR